MWFSRRPIPIKSLVFHVRPSIRTGAPRMRPPALTLKSSISTSTQPGPSTSSGHDSSSSTGFARRHALGIMAGGVLVLSQLAYFSYKSPIENEQLQLHDTTAQFEPRRSRGLVPFDEVARHNTRDDCWVIINNQVYNVTKFLEAHPGGVHAIVKLAGKDVTKIFGPIHPPDALDILPPEAKIGPLDLTTVPAEVIVETDEEIRIRKARESLPIPQAALNLNDVEELAVKVLTTVALAYYAGGGDDEYSHRENAHAFKRYWFRPRVLNDVTTVSTATTMFGCQTSLPVYVSPAAMARLGHPGGEVNIVQASGDADIIQGVSINASCSLDEMVAARQPGQSLVFQIYLDKNRDNSRKLLRRIERAGFKAVMLTVDSAVPGNREGDQRAKGHFEAPSSDDGSDKRKAKGVAQAISGYQDPKITWNDVQWIRSITKLPLFIKGIQSVEDAELAHQAGVNGIILSNHGGRSLDFAPAPIDVLYELHQQRPDLTHNPKFDIYIDGGVRRGTDVLKALCLGAKGVGLGRPILYGNSVWGKEGVARVLDIMRKEIETDMRLMGVTNVSQLKPSMVRYMGCNPSKHSPYFYKPNPPTSKEKRGA